MINFKLTEAKWRLSIFFAIILLSITLRFYQLGTNPPGLYWDEAVFGYDAYSISKIGRDHRGHFMPLFFESFGDWKLPAYHYLLVPSVKILGLSEFSVRLPAALLGFLTVVIFFFLIKQITKNINLALVSMLFLAISPWHIQFSRGGFESTAGLFFIVSALYLFLLGISKKNILFLALAFLLFTLSIYSYHAYRLFTPLFVISLIILNIGFFKKNFRALLLPGFITLLLTLPMIIFTFSPNGRARAISQSAFNKEEVEMARLDFNQKSKKPLRFLSKYLFQSPVYYSQVVLKGYLDHFSPTFLFLQGDQIGRHSQVDMGQIYLFEAVLIPASLLALKKLKDPGCKITIIWLLLAPIPATIVTPTPHAYRTLQMTIPLAFFSGLGVYYIFAKAKHLAVKIALVFVAIYFFASFTHLLFNHYPKKFAADWQDGYREMVKKVQQYQVSYEKVLITNINRVPYIYLLFYQNYDPSKFIAQKGTRDAFNKYVFIDQETNIYNKGKILYVAPSWQKVDGLWLTAAGDSSGRLIYNLWEVGKD